jgi:hypothetical protein
LGEPKTSFLEDLLDFSKTFPLAVSRPFSFRPKKKNVEFLESKNEKLSSIAGNHKKNTKNYHLPLYTFPKDRNIKSKKIMTKAYLHSRSPKAPTSFAHELINSLYFTNITNEIFKISKHAPLQKL